MIISVDVHRSITEFNHAAEQAFGYSKAEVLGKPVDFCTRTLPRASGYIPTPSRRAG